MWRRHMLDSWAAGRGGSGAAAIAACIWRALADRLLRRSAHLLRQLAGMPDYAAHVEHLRRCHPNRAVPTEREFFDEYVRARYADGPTRCC
jgi:uncharacterized short protein YbdD (DUF466 family)